MKRLFFFTAVKLNAHWVNVALKSRPPDAQVLWVSVGGLYLVAWILIGQSE